MGELYTQERPISELLLSFVLLDSRISLTAALTNVKLGKEMKLCDLTNNVMFKQFFLENNNKQRQAIHYKGDMYVHVTDKENHCGRRNLICGLCLDDQHPSESSVNIISSASDSYIVRHIFSFPPQKKNTAGSRDYSASHF